MTQRALDVANQHTRLWLLPFNKRRRKAAAAEVGQLMAGVTLWLAGTVDDEWFLSDLEKRDPEAAASLRKQLAAMKGGLDSDRRAVLQ